MQVYYKNMRKKKKNPYIPYIYSRIHTIHAAGTPSTFERTFIKWYKKGSWCQEEHKRKYRVNIKVSSYN